MATRTLTVVLDMDTIGLSRGTSKAKASMTTLSGSARQASASVDVVSASVNKLNTSTIKAVDGLQTWRRGITTARVIGLAFAGTLGVMSAKIVQVGMDAQRTKALLEGLSTAKTEAGRQAQAALEFRFLREFAKTAPFGMDAIKDAFVKLKTAGIDPTTGALDAMVSGIAKVGGSDENLKRATVAIQQMAGKGTVSMEELRGQLGEAMPQALRLMAEAAKQSVPDFIDTVSKGKVQFSAKLSKEFFGLVLKDAGDAKKRLQETLGGQVNLAKAELTNIASLLVGVDEGRVLAGGVIDELTKSTREFVSYLKSPEGVKAAKDLGSAFAGMVASVRDVSKFVAENIALFKTLAGVVAAAYLVQGVKSSATAMAEVRKSILGNVSAATTYATAVRTQRAEEAAAARTSASRWADFVSRKKNELALVDQTIARIKVQQDVERGNLDKANGYNRERGYTVVPTGDAAVARSQAMRAAAAANLARLERELATATVARTAVEGRLASASTFAAAADARNALAKVALARAASPVAIAFRSLTGLAGGLVSAMGGPVGIALMAAAAAFGYVSTRAREADAAMREVGQKSRDLAEAAIQTRESQNDFSESLKLTSDKSLVAADSSYKYASALDQVRRNARLAGEEIAYMTTQQRIQMREETQKRVRDAKRGLEGGLLAEGLEEKIARAEAEVAGLYSGGRYMPGMAQTSQVAQTALQGRLSAKGAPRGAMDHLQELYDKRREVSTGIAQDEAMLKVIADSIGKPVAVRPTPKDKPDTTQPPKVKPDKKSASANIGLENDALKLEATRKALAAVADGAGASAEAVELVKAKVQNLENQGAKLSKEKIDELMTLAKTQVQVDRGLAAASNITQKADESATGLSETIASLHENNGQASGSTAKLAREQAILLQRITDANTEGEKFSETLLRQKSAAIVASSALSGYANAILQLKMANADDEASMNGQGPSYWTEYAKTVSRINSERLEAEKRIAEVRNAGDAVEADRLQKQLDDANKERDAALATARKGMLEKARLDVEDREWALKDNGATEEQKIRNKAARADAEVQKLRNQRSKLTDPADIAGLDEIILRLEKINSMELAVDLKTPVQQMLEQWRDGTARMKELQADWANDFMNVIANGGRGFKAFVTQMVMDWIAAQMKMQMAQAASKGGGGGGWLSSLTKIGTKLFAASAGAGAGSWGSSSDYASLLAAGSHAGSIVGKEATFLRHVDPRIFNDARRMHTGGVAGLKPGEVPTILKNEEGVFTPEQMSRLAPVGKQQAPNVQVNMINETGQPVQGEQQGGRFDGESYVVDIVVGAMNKRGRLRDSMKSVK